MQASYRIHNGWVYSYEISGGYTRSGRTPHQQGWVRRCRYEGVGLEGLCSPFYPATDLDESHVEWDDENYVDPTGFFDIESIGGDFDKLPSVVLYIGTPFKWDEAARCWVYRGHDVTLYLRVRKPLATTLIFNLEGRTTFRLAVAAFVKDTV